MPAPLAALTASTTGVESAPAKSRAITLETVAALLSAGSTDASIPLQRIPSAGVASATSATTVTTATVPGCRITAWARRYQRPLSAGPGFTFPRRCPVSMNSAGRRTTVDAPAISATTSPPTPIEIRKRCGKTVRHAIAAATVTALKTTVRPAVRIVRRTASGTSAPRPSSSRKRDTHNRL